MRNAAIDPAVMQSRFVAWMDRRRRDLGLSWREMGRQAGLKSSTISRLTNGREVEASVIFRLIAWAKNVERELTRRVAA